MKKVAEIVSAILSIFVSLPIWLFLLYNILKAINPDRLVWFLYGIYIPVCFLNAIISAVIKLIEDEN